MRMRNQESEIGFLGASAGLPSSGLYHLFERALVSVIRGAMGTTTFLRLTDGKRAHTQVRAVHSTPRRVWAQT